MWADADELTTLASVVARHGGLYTSHIRSESDELLEAADEFLAILERSGCRGQFSHIKTAGGRNWHKLTELSRRLSAARARGIAVTADRYPYTASATDLGTIVLPRAALAGSQEQVLARLAEPASRGRIIRQIRRQMGDDLARWHEAVVITSVGQPALRPCIGKNLRQIADFLHVADATEAAIQLIHDDRLLTQAIHFSMSESNLREIYTWDFVAVGSDSSCRSRLETGEEERPHPRAYGTPARFWELAVRRWGILSPGAAVRRLTSLPAEILGLKDRGVLRDGAAADITVIEPEVLADRATYEDPCRPPAGVRLTIVNGQIVWRDGQATGLRPGRMLKSQRNMP
jgi:N-acyl-D-amino-acid deacylase